MGSRILDHQTYTEYLAGDHWQKVRQHALWASGHRCQLCHGTERLEVHHATYENLGAESLEDLAVLCAPCHSAYEKGLELAREEA